MKLTLAALLSGALALTVTGSIPSTHTRSHQPVTNATAPAGPTGTNENGAAIPNPGRPPFIVGPVSNLAHGKHTTSQQPFFRGGVRPHPGAAGPSAGNTPKTPTPSAQKAAVYGGLNQPGMSADLTTPPDSTGAVGPNHYVEMDNSNIAVYDRSLNLLASATLDAFTGSGGGADWCDPQVQWDQAAGRWLMAFLLCNGAPGLGGQGFVLAWSKNANPTDLAIGWCLFGIQTGDMLFDYPKLGHNSNWEIVGGNFYDFSALPPNQPFLGAALGWMRLPANGASVSSCPTTFPAFGLAGPPLTNGDGTTWAFTPVPVNTMSGAANGYVISAYDPAGNVGFPATRNKLSVWHIDSAGTLHQDSDIAVSSYDTPPVATQNGSSNTIDTLDGRLTQAVGDATTGIWTQHTVKNGSVSKVTWYELALSGLTLTKVQEGDITSGTDFVFNAAVSPTYGGNGAAVIEYNRSSSSIKPVIAVRTRWSTTPSGTFASDESIIASSPAADVESFSCNNPPGSPCRWGDYSAATPDPVQNFVVWGTNEFNTAATAAPAWRDENFAIAAWVPPGPPINIVASAGDAHACVGWTPSSIDSGAPDLSYTVRAYQGASLVKSIVVASPANAACVTGLTDDIAYTFTVSASNAAGPGPESAHSIAVTPTRSQVQAPAASLPPRDSSTAQAPPASPKPR